MADYDAGRVFLTIVPSFRGVQNAISGEAERWGRDAGRNFQQGFDREVGRSRTTVGPSASDSRRQGSEAGGAFGDAFKRRVEAAMRSLPPARLRADASEAERTLRDVRLHLQELSNKTIGVDIDADRAMAELARIDRQLSDLDRDDAEIQVRVDAGAARAQLAAIQAQVNSLDGDDVNIRVDVDTSRGLSGLNTFTGRLAALITAGSLVAPAIVPAAGAAAAALAGIGLGATAGLAGIGALVIGFNDLSDAIKLLDKAEETSAANAVRAASQRAAAAESVASAQRSLESAERGLNQARASAANQAEDAARRVAEAQEAVGEATREANQAVEAATRRVAEAQREVGEVTEDVARDVEQALRRQLDAEENLAAAQRRTQRAQEDLTRAREDAREALEDLELSVRGAALAEEDAELGLARARERLLRATSEGWEGLDLEEAQLAVRQAELRFDQARERNIDVQAEAEEARRAGIDGAQAVLNAEEQLANARSNEHEAIERIRDAELEVIRTREDGADRVARAQEALTLAVQAQERAQVDAAERVADAQDRVTQAVIAQQRQQEQSAFAVAGAIAGVEGAQASLASALAASAAAGSGLTNQALEDFNELSPAMQAFAGYVDATLIPAWTRLRDAVQAALLPDVRTAIDMLLPFEAAITDFAVRIGDVMGGLFIEAAEAIAGPEMQRFFDYLSKTAPGVLQTLGSAAIDVFVGMANLFVQFGPLAEDVIGWIGDMAEKFREWTRTLDSNDAFQGMLDYIRENGPLIEDFFEALGDAIPNIIRSMAPFGPIVLKVATALLNMVAAVPPDVLAGLVLGFQALSLAFSGLRAVTGIITLFQTLAPLLTVLTGPVGLVVLGVIALGAAFVLAYKNSETFRDIVHGVLNVIAGVFTWLWDTIIRPIFELFKRWMDVSLIDALRGLGGVVSSVWEAIRSAIGGAWTWVRDNVFSPVANFLDRTLTGAFNGLRDTVRTVWEGIRSAISGAWNWIRDNVFTPIGDAVRGLGGLFGDAVGAIGSAWSRVQEAVAAPIRWVIDTVLRDGIGKAFDWIAEKIGLDVRISDNMPTIGRAPAADTWGTAPGAVFAQGGIYPGYTPGRDIGYAAVSGGEAIMRPEWTRAVGADLVHAMNRVARLEGPAGVRRKFFGGYQLGGVVSGGVDLAKEGLATVGGAFGAVTGAVGDFIVGQFKKAAEALVNPLIEKIPKTNFLGEMLYGAAKKLAGGLFDFGGKKDSDALSGGAFSVGGGNFGPILSGRNAANTQAAINFVEKMWGPFVGVIGGYRPSGSVATSDHPKGKALDVMIDNWTKAAGIFAGNAIASWFVSNPAMFGTKYVIWRDMINKGRGWQPYSHPSNPGNRNPTLAHRDHVHVSLFDRGGRLDPGMSMVMNGTGRSELILNPDQEGQIAMALRERHRPAPGGFINYGPIHVRDERALAREIDMQYRLSAMRIR